MKLLPIQISILLLIITSPALAQNLAIMKCGDMPNQKGLPVQWPCEVRPLGSGNSCPLDFTPCTVVTETQYAAYKDARQSQYDAWISSQGPDPTASPKPSLEDRVTAIENRLTAGGIK